MKTSLSLKQQWVQGWKELTDACHEDDPSWDDEPYRWLNRTRERREYERFIELLDQNAIDYFDTYPMGGSCVMVYPTPTIELSCIFHCMVDPIEIKICQGITLDYDYDDTNDNDVGLYDKDCQLYRSSSVDSAVDWIKNKLK